MARSFGRQRNTAVKLLVGFGALGLSHLVFSSLLGKLAVNPNKDAEEVSIMPYNNGDFGSKTKKTSYHRKSLPYNNGDFEGDTKKTSYHWKSSRSAVLGMANGYGMNVYTSFVGSLRATGYLGHIILGIAKDAPSEIIAYLAEQNVTVKYIERADKCTYSGTIGSNGRPLNMESWKCPKDHPDYKISWARFPYYRDWLDDCPSCTDGVVLTDVRDAFFQRDPFVIAVERNQEHPLMVFQEHPDIDNTHWLTNIPVSACRKYRVGPTPVLCSGSVMGSREGIISYINEMVEEFDYWMERESCRSDMVGDDQSIHNYLYYTGRLKQAVSIPHREGPLHVVGYHAARIYENATSELQAKDEKKNLNNVNEFYVKDGNWKEWLPRKYGLLDVETGLIVNLDGTPSAQVHQVDRYGSLMRAWKQKMEENGWPYNKA